MSAGLELCPISLRDANAFVERWHRHCDPVQGAKFSLSAWVGETLVGVAIVGRPTARRLDNGLTAEVLRVAVIIDAPKGTNSWLLIRAKRAAQAMGYRRVTTCTLADESGDSLRAINATPVGEIAPARWDVPSRRRKHRDIEEKFKIRWDL